MLSILVCHSYYLRLDHKQVLRAKPYPPLATLQVVAMLREAGRVLYPLPGTQFHHLVKAQLLGKAHWQESDDLEMMFQGTYTSDFYRTVRNLLRDQITLQTVDMMASSDERITAIRRLDQRWNELLSREFQYRSPVDRTVAAG